jgi:hypothetical protein
MNDATRLTTRADQACRDVVIAVAEQGQCSLECQNRHYLCSGATCTELLKLSAI